MDVDDNIRFMIFNWYSDDRSLDLDSDDEYPEKVFHIYMFGVDEDGNSIYVEINDFTPFFYVKIPGAWVKTDVNGLVSKIREKLKYDSKYLISHKVMMKKDGYGFNNNKRFKFLRLVFSNYSKMKRVKYMFKNNDIEGYNHIKFQLYNSNVDPLLLFIHLCDIQPSGWVEIDKGYLTKNRNARCSKCYTLLKWKYVTPLDKHNIPPLKTLSFDLECYSSTGAFPNYEFKDDKIIQIGSSVHRFGDNDDIDKYVFVLGECDKDKNINIVECKNEKDLIIKWVEHVKDVDPDQIIGYNIDDFDWTYLWKRAELNNCIPVLEELSRLHHVPSEFSNDTMESNAYGMNIFNYIKTPGVGQIDLLHWFRRETKLDSYKLDHVAKTFLNDKKRDVSPKEIFRMGGPDGDGKSRKVVAQYCAHDTVLPILLMENRCMLPNLIEMSKVTYVPVTWLIMRGQQIKVYSQLQKEMRKREFLLPEVSNHNDKGGYEGATVLDCKRGAYWEPVSGLDFKSLYPSIMIAHNLCPTTWVRLPKYDDLEGIEYKKVVWDNGNYSFVQNVKGVVPDILTRLWDERNKTKKEMKAEKDKRIKDILNGKQLAIKVSMNSIYGFFGVTKGMIPCKPIASTVTYIGRKMIEHSMNCAQLWYDGSERSKGVKAEVIYGDSVRGDMPVTMISKTGKHIIPRRIDAINNTEWFPFHEFKSNDPELRNKEQAGVDPNFLVWSANGWVRVIRIIRHKTPKRLYRVITKKGIVVCTEDHSLINKNNQYVKPKDVEVGTELLHRFIDKKRNFNVNTINIVEERQRAFYNKFI